MPRWYISVHLYYILIADSLLHYTLIAWDRLLPGHFIAISLHEPAIISCYEGWHLFHFSADMIHYGHIWQTQLRPLSHIDRPLAEAVQLHIGFHWLHCNRLPFYSSHWYCRRDWASLRLCIWRRRITAAPLILCKDTDVFIFRGQLRFRHSFLRWLLRHYEIDISHYFISFIDIISLAISLFHVAAYFIILAIISIVDYWLFH